MSRYICADLHGNLKLWQEIEKFLKPTDTVYVLGDCGDRGDEPWETIKAVAANPKAVYIKGNHEDMLAKAMKEWLEDGHIGHDAYLLFSNGGSGTLHGWLNDGAKIGWMNYLNKLPTHIELLNTQGIRCHLVHAGFTPGSDIKPTEKDLIWNRDHFYDNWYGKDNELVIHGHTNVVKVAHLIGEPFAFDTEEKLGAFWYCDNHKVCIDLGTYITGQTVLLDLDTFDEHIFKL